MNYYVVIAALIISFAVVFVLSLLSKRPFGGLWAVLLIVFMATWAGQIWINPMGPVTAGISWMALIIVSVFVGLLTLALLPSPPDPNDKNRTDTTTISVGLFFWLTMILLIAAVGLGFYLF